VAAMGFTFSCFGFFFSRLLFCSPLAILSFLFDWEVSAAICHRGSGTR
jgi:hypothetical protein